MSFFEEIRYLWVHSRPYTKRVRSRYAIAIVGILVVTSIAQWLHFPRWLAVVLSLIPLIYMLHAFLMFFGADLNWEAREKDQKLGQLLTSPDLRERFKALRLRLHESDAEQLSRLQDAMEFGAREAQRLAEEIRKNEGITVAMRERQDKDRQSAEALAKLLDCQVERVAEIIERKGRKTQWILLIMGAVLGAAIQALAQWIF